MKFSTFHLFSQPPDWSYEDVYRYEMQVIRWADELGFDTAWVAEHHFRWYGTAPNTMVMLANLAAQTKRIRLGNAIVILPFHNPLRVAEDAAMVDLLSEGRLNFGFGRGYQSAEFAGFGLSMEDTRGRTDEALDVILQAWTGEPVHHNGRHYQIDGVRVVPTPLQRPRPPVWVASISQETIRHYAPQGIPFLVSGTTGHSEVIESCRMWRELAAAHGHDVESAEIVCSRPVYIADSTEEAREFVRRQPPGLPFASSFDLTRVPMTAEEEFAQQSAD